MEEHYKCRVMELEDIPDVLFIRKADQQVPLVSELTDAMLENALLSYCRGWVIVDEEERCLGFCIANKRSRNIWGIFVQEEYQSNGFGAEMLEEATQWLCEQRYGFFYRPAKKIFVQTKAQGSAVDFYLLQGWKKDKILKDGELQLYYLNPFYLAEDTEQ